jgi:probable phosphoglycerate mutase
MRDGVTIYFIRHGETDWNAERRYQGQRDIPLNERGRAQARRNGGALAALLPAIAQARFVASPLSRAVETMRLVRAALALEGDGFALDPRLMELSYGDWEGRLAADLMAEDPGYARRHLDPLGFRPKGGESYADLMQRTSAWLAEVAHDTVVVSHGGVSRTLRAEVLGLDGADLLRLDVPQDRVLVLRNNTADWL